MRGYAHANFIKKTRFGSVGLGLPLNRIAPFDVHTVLQQFACQQVKLGKDIRVLCEEINADGFRTRSRRRWNADYSQVVGQEALHEHLRGYLGDLTFTKEVADRFEQHLREVWAEKVGDLNRHLASANSELATLREQADSLITTISHIQNPDLLKRLESDYDDLFGRIKLLESKREEKEYSEADMNRAIDWAKYLVEHLDELIVDADDEGLRAIFWSLVFTQPPTLAEIQNRTAPLSPLVRFKDKVNDDGSGLVRQTELEMNRVWEELIRWFVAFSRDRIDAGNQNYFSAIHRASDR